MAYFLAILFGGFFAFNAFATPKKVARAVESALHRIFPEAQVSADVQGKRGRAVLKGQFRSARVEMSHFSFDLPRPLVVTVVPSAKNLGRVGHLEIVLRDFRYQGFRIASVEMSMDNLRVDWRALRKESKLKLVSPPIQATISEPRATGRARIVLGQDAPQAWVRAKYPDLQNATVALSADKSIRVNASRTVLGAELPLVLSGRLNLREGRVLEVIGTTVTAGNATLPAAFSAPFAKGLSSIYALDPVGRWPLAVSGAELKVQNVAGAPSLVLDAAISIKPAATLTSP